MGLDRVVDTLAVGVVIYVGFVVGDTVRRIRDERTVERFNVQLNATAGVPAGWRMRNR